MYVCICIYICIQVAFNSYIVYIYIIASVGLLICLVHRLLCVWIATVNSAFC